MWHESLFDFSNAYEYAQYLGALVDIRFNEKTGLVAINHGRAGYALNGTIGGTTTLGQTGKLGANEAFLYDGLTSIIRVPNFNPGGQITYCTLQNPSGPGENNLGMFWAWGNGDVDTPRGANLFFNSNINSLTMRVHSTAPDTFITNTTTGLNAGEWALVFASYNDAGDRKSHLYKGLNSGITEYGYLLQSTVVGTLAVSANPLNIGNRTNQIFTFAGLYDWFLIFPRVLTLAEMTNLTKLAGV